MATKSPSFFERTRTARKIIVIDFGFLGDSIHLIPALWEIKRNYPAAKLHVLSATLGTEVLKLAPCVDEPWAFPLTTKSPMWWQHWDILRKLRREKFDVAINFSGADRTIFATRFIGAKHTLAHEGGRKHFWSRWLRWSWVPRMDRGLTVFEQRRQVLAAGGLSLAPPKFDLRVPLDARDWAGANTPPNAIHLAITASNAVKEWPLENWVEFVRLAVAGNPHVRLVASAGPNPREREKLRTLAHLTNTTQLQCVEGLTIPKLAALLQRCRLQVGADSGVLHLAMALGVPTMTVYRENSGLTEWSAVGPQHRRIVAPCRCIEKSVDDCSIKGRAACLAAIPAQRVLDEACQLLG